MNKRIKHTIILSCTLACLPFANMAAQQKTVFEKVGTGDETQQEFFPGEHRARPVFGDYTNSGYMGLFSGGQEPSNWTELATLAYRNDEGTFTLDENTGIAGSTYTNAVFFDYDNDGNLDLLIMGGENDKKVELYHNLGIEGNYHFEKVSDTGFRQSRDEDVYLNPISTGDYNHDGYADVLTISNDSEGRHIDLYLNDKGSGKFIRQTDASFENVSKGSVTFGDLNNDGWLDLVYCGYGNGPTTKIYINNQDGTFTDKTPADLKGVYEGQTALADINGDGTLDILCTGLGNDGRLASFYYNTLGENKECSYQYVSAEENGLLGVNKGTPLIADFNGDGKMDIILNGWGENGGDRNRIYYQNAEGKFILDESDPLIATRDGGINMGDANGDGNMDLIIGGYKDEPYNTPLRVYENHPEKEELAPNTFPEAPEDVTVKMEGNELVISWSAGSDKETPEAALRYNLFVQNKTTGKLYMIIPADIETGKLKVGTDLQTSLSSSIRSYRINQSAGSEYTVGVQTLDQSYAGSVFKTASYEPVNIDQIEKRNQFKVKTAENGLIVYGDNNREITVYATDGRIIGRGLSNTLIPLAERGLYIISVKEESAPLKCIY